VHEMELYSLIAVTGLFIWLLAMLIWFTFLWLRDLLSERKTKLSKVSNLNEVVTFELSTINTTNFKFDFDLYRSMLKALSTIYDLKKYDYEIEYNQYHFSEKYVSVKLDNGNLLNLASIYDYYGVSEENRLKFIPNVSQDLSDEIKRTYLSLIALYTWSINNCVTDLHGGDREVKTQHGNFILKAHK